MAVDVVEAWCSYQAVRGFSENTIKRRRCSLRAWRGFLEEGLDSAGVSDVEQFLARYKSASTRHAVLSDVRLFYDWAISRGVILCVDPTELVGTVRKPKRVPTPIGPDDVERMIVATSHPIRLMVLLGAYAGFRVSEIARLHGRDVNVAENIVTVREGKGKKDRRVPVHPRLMRELHPVPMGRYFPGLDAAKVSYRIGTVLRRLEIHGRPHDLRAAFCTEAARRSNGNLVLVAKLAGHESMETTKRYVGWDPEGAALVDQLYSA